MSRFEGYWGIPGFLTWQSPLSGAAARRRSSSACALAGRAAIAQARLESAQQLALAGADALHRDELTHHARVLVFEDVAVEHQWRR